MKNSKLLSKLALASLTMFVLNSCNKQEEELTNIDAFRKEADAAQVIDYSTVSNDLLLEDRVNGVDYIIKNLVEVNANITIKPGVTLMFENGAGLKINEEGSLTAIGVQSNEILFTSQSGKRGDWAGILFLSNSPKNILSYCKIEQGGGITSWGSANVTVGTDANKAKAEISNCEITTSKQDGIALSKGSELVNFSNNKMVTNSAHPMVLHIADAGMFGNNNTYSNNGKEFIKLVADGNMITTPINIAKLNEPYLISGNVVAGNSFTIASGSRIYMDNGSEIVIDGKNGNGSFSAVGTASQPIQISAIYNGTGVWQDIKFLSSSSSNNRIEYCTISGGGLTSNGFEGMVNVVNPNGGSSNIVIRNSNIMNSAAIGIYIQSSNSEYNSDITTSNQFANNAKGNVHIE